MWKNWETFGQKYKFWKQKWNFGQKLKFWAQTEILDNSQTYSQKEILLKK